MIIMMIILILVVGILIFKSVYVSSSSSSSTRNDDFDHKLRSKIILYRTNSICVLLVELPSVEWNVFVDDVNKFISTYE